MVFSSLLFIYAFLPAFLLLYFLVPRRFGIEARNAVALISSYVFYSWGAPTLIVLLVVSSFVDYAISLRFDSASARLKKQLLFAGVGFNLLFLLYYKYANFFIGEVNRSLHTAGLSEIAWAEIALPIGISFFTFQKLSYLVDVYRGTAERARSFVDYALYVALFPQLIAGPIVRYHDIAKQLRLRRESRSMVSEGLYRFGIGLGKKVLIADEMGAVVNAVFSIESASLPIEYAWLGAICYAFQIYFDFSGYSDMAIGLGKIMGFTFLENFNRPYTSKSITEFWRRWHISLSNWMKEYLYIPLGGNRLGAFRTYCNLWIVFLLSGFWHGAEWTFIAWGAYHGLFLVIDRLGWQRIAARLPAPLSVLITFVLVLFGWVLFRADSISSAWSYISVMLGVRVPTDVLRIPTWGEVIGYRQLFVFGVAAIISFCPLPKPLFSNVEERDKGPRQLTIAPLRVCVSFVIAALAVMTLVNSHFSPFLYFRF